VIPSGRRRNRWSACLHRPRRGTLVSTSPTSAVVSTLVSRKAAPFRSYETLPDGRGRYVPYRDYKAFQGGERDSNPRPPGPQPGALPTELPPPRSSHRVPSAAAERRAGSRVTLTQLPGSACARRRATKQAARKVRRYPSPHAPVAQGTERRTSNPRVGGSNPPGRVSNSCSEEFLGSSREGRRARMRRGLTFERCGNWQ
jgi:hypothetical protein